MGPCLSTHVGGHALTPPTDRRLGRPLPYQLANQTHTDLKVTRPIMNEDYIPGEDCTCSAWNESECGCGVDWTPREVYELREQRDMLVEALLSITKGSHCLECYGGDSIWIAEQALAAVKGGKS